MSVFKKLTYTAEDILESLLDELIDMRFSRDLSFMLVLDEVDEPPHIDFFIEGIREDLDTYFFTLFFDQRSKEFYYWNELTIGGVGVSAKLFIHHQEQLKAVVNQEINIILSQDMN